MKNEKIDASALETAPKINKNINDSKKVDSSNIEWLKTANVMDYLEEGNLQIVSSKFDSKREPKVQEGLTYLENLEINGVKINPLIILLAKWWEHKEVRKEIKNLIDAEAELKGYEPSDYLQNVLGAQIEIFAAFQTAIDRIKYAKTYFLPRNGVKTSIKTKQVRIEGQLYNVPIIAFNALLEKYPNHKDNAKAAKELRKETIAISTLVEAIEEL